MTETAEATDPMQVWVDAQLPPSLAHWLRTEHAVDALHLADLGMLQERDLIIHDRAKAQSRAVVIITKDDDFVRLLGQFGSPPQVVWVRCGNVRNRELRRIVLEAWPKAIELLTAGEPLVEMRPRRDTDS
ncbi:MAG: DUF5615 family PIN-like protein [Bernardetiaceae bacterium]|nr:DUF5615 family PIN-like protein [Bernardetiaceae bacterium]